MENDETKRKTKMLVVVALAVCLVTIATTAAYFVTTITSQNQEATVTTGTMSMTFKDRTNGVNAALMFGESVTKEFTLENTGTLDVTAKISWLELINTYLAESLTYKLEYATTDGGAYTEVISGNVPRSVTESTQELANGLTVPGGESYYYKLTITLENLDDIDQTVDLNASFKTKFTISESADILVMFNANGGIVSTTSKAVRNGYTYGALPTPTYEGYNFLGWYTSAEGGEQITSSTPANLTESQTLYARWELVLGVDATIGNLNITPKSGDPTFANAAMTDEGVYAMEDNYGTSYYYRGAVTNNYVNFAGFYWRIIRINGDGSIRMIYDGTQAYANGTSNTDRSALSSITWNETNKDDAKYLGYMYGGANGTASTTKESAQTNTISTNVKTQLESWYKTNIEDKGYSQYLADVIFCNDRSTSSTPGQWWIADTTYGYGTQYTAYGVMGRLYDGSTSAWSDNPNPSFICPTNTAVNNNGNNDWFTAEATSENKGNGALEYPVGLITADEIMTAGSGKPGTANTYYYLNKGHLYWSLSPGNVYASGNANVFIVSTDGSIGSNYVNLTGAVAPVINLSSETAATLIGDGTIGNEYRLPTT